MHCEIRSALAKSPVICSVAAHPKLPTHWGLRQFERGIRLLDKAHLLQSNVPMWGDYFRQSPDGYDLSTETAMASLRCERNYRPRRPLGDRRKGVATLDYILLICVILPLAGFVMWAGPRIMNLVYEMTCVLISWPFL